MSRSIAIAAIMVGGCSDDSGPKEAFEPTATGSGPGGTSAADDGNGDDGDGDGGATCEPDAQRECLCDDGLSLGIETCAPDGSGYGDCACDGADSATTGDGGDASSGSGGVADEVCYPGEDLSWTTCLPLHGFAMAPEGYDYPDPLNGDPNYRKPVAYIDLEQNDPSTMLAPNFALDELAQLAKGRWAIVQPHAVESLQGLRDAVGSIVVTSAYRSPAYNAMVGGVPNSRHMFGDGFDLSPSAVPLATLEAECTAVGGMLVEYDTHVHCDFRSEDVDELFFGPAPAAAPSPLPFAGTLVRTGNVYTTEHIGFDEGAPVHRWTARGADGQVIVEAIGPVFVAPTAAVQIEVSIGGPVVLTDTRSPS